MSFKLPADLFGRYRNRIDPTVWADDQPYRTATDQSGVQVVRQDQEVDALIGVDVRPWPALDINPVFRLVNIHTVHDNKTVHNAPEFSVFTEITERTEMTENSDIIVIRVGRQVDKRLPRQRRGQGEPLCRTLEVPAM